MKNEQVFEIITVDNEPSGLRVMVQYDLENQRTELAIPYTELAPYINEQYPVKVFKSLSGMLCKQVSFEADDVALLDQDTLEQHVRTYLFKKLRVDLIIENRKLKRRLQMAKQGVLLMGSVLVDNFQKLADESSNYANDRLMLGQHTMCEQVIYHGKNCIEWFEDNVLLTEKTHEEKDSENRLAS